MGQRIYTEVFDDLDGVPGDDVKTVAFAFEGTTYEIDLGPGNLKRLSEALQDFIDGARVTKGKAAKPKAKTVSPVYARLPAGEASRLPVKTRDGLVMASVARAWAAENGIEFNANGRLRAAVVKQFIEAHPEVLPDLDVENDG